VSSTEARFSDLLSAESAAPFGEMTFPLYREYLSGLASGAPNVAAAAWTGDEPAGLALGCLRRSRRCDAEVLSLFVHAEERNRGIGTALLTRVEQALRDRGATLAGAVYMTGRPDVAALERVLEKRGWSSPRLRMLVCEADPATLAAPWLRRRRVSPGWSMVSWADVTEEQRRSLLESQAAEAWIPADLVPFDHEAAGDPETSVALLREDRVVGWLITHRLSPLLVRYTCSFLRPDLQRTGTLLSLYGEAAARQAAVQNGSGRAIWTVPVQHEAMVRFVRRRMAPFLRSLRETRGSIKRL